MNINTVLIDNNKYLITNEHGDIRLIKKRDKKHDLDEEVQEKILKKENIIETAEIELKEKENSLKILKNNEKIITIFNLILLLAATIIFFICINILPITHTIIATLISSILLKTLDVSLFGTKWERGRKRETIKKELSDFKLTLDKLYEQLDQMKKIIEFEEVTITEKNNYKITPIINTNQEVKTNQQSKPKTRILKLEK